MQDGFTPLMEAVKRRKLDMVELLMKHNPDVSAVDNVRAGFKDMSD